jgi:hypothetical protein
VKVSLKSISWAIPSIILQLSAFDASFNHLHSSATTMKFLALAATTAALCATQTSAKPSFLPLIPGSQNVKGVAAIGHINPKGGGDPNPFGADFYKAEKKWSVDLCYKDSDSDGQFNGAELGDPCCEWVQDTNEKLAYTTATAPGDKASMQDPTVWASVKCADGSSPEAKYKAFMASAGGAGSGASSSKNETAPVKIEAPGASKVPASSSAAPAATTKAPASGASQIAVAASAVTVAVAAMLA